MKYFLLCLLFVTQGFAAETTPPAAVVEAAPAKPGTEAVPTPATSPGVPTAVKASADDPSKSQGLTAAEIEARIRENANRIELSRETLARLAAIRDPFQKPDLMPQTHLAPPLESFAVEQMEFVGVITGPLRIRALLKLPDGKVHMIQERTRLGNNGGVVRAITTDTITVREKMINPILGEEEILDKELKIKKQKNVNGS